MRGKLRESFLKSLWPDVLEVIRDMREELPVVPGKFSHEVALMRDMDVGPAKPARIFISTVLELNDLLEPVEHGVFVAPSNPLLAHGDSIVRESGRVPTPHPCSWVVHPSFGQAVIRSNELPSLDPLLPQPLAV